MTLHTLNSKTKQKNPETFAPRYLATNVVCQMWPPGCCCFFYMILMLKRHSLGMLPTGITEAMFPSMGRAGKCIWYSVITDLQLYHWNSERCWSACLHLQDRLFSVPLGPWQKFVKPFNSFTFIQHLVARTQFTFQLKVDSGVKHTWKRWQHV